jgi:hypothetical protein
MLPLGAARGARSESTRPRPDSWTGNTFEVEAALEHARPHPAEPAPAPANRGSGPAEPSDRSAGLPERTARAVGLPARTSRSAGARTPSASGPTGRSNVEPLHPAGSSEGSVTYGAEGDPEGVRSLARAFTRAIPPATSLDRAWREMPLGRAGTLRIELVVERGKIEEVKGLDQGPLHLRRLVTRTVALIERGRFAIHMSDLDSGREVLSISAVVTTRAHDSELSDSDAVMELGSEGPTRERPGRAFFTLASGRHVELTVRVLSGAEQTL